MLPTLKQLIRPGEEWSLDVDLRYLPVAARLRAGRPARLLEVGSGMTGITPYLHRDVIGCDATFEGPVARRLIPVIAQGPLPFRDGAFDAVISLDTLEHVPRPHRELFVRELLRVSSSVLYVGFPEGDGAQAHDTAMEAYYRRQRPAIHPYFVEHREFGIPQPGEFEGLLDAAAASLGVQVNVHRLKNVNIRLRSLFMRLIWHRSAVLWRVYLALSALARFGPLFHWGTCYRMIYTITVHRPQT